LEGSAGFLDCVQINNLLASQNTLYYVHDFVADCWPNCTIKMLSRHRRSKLILVNTLQSRFFCLLGHFLELIIGFLLALTAQVW
jgi:hypothetical protein